MKTIVCIDGDILAYRCASAAEERYVIVKHKASGKEQRFSTKTDFWGRDRKHSGGWLAEKNKQRLEKELPPFSPEEFEITEGREAQNVANALHSVKLQIKTIVKLAKADTYEVYLSGDTNFRDNLPLPFQYKSNRTGEKPKLLEECRRYLLEKHLAKLSVNCEADDDLVTRAMMAKNSKTEKIIIASIDKDQTQAFGTYLLNWTEEKPEVRLIPDFGELQLTEDKHVKFTGRLGAYFQWIYGDRVDFYCPYDLAEGAKFGEMSAYNALKNCKDDFDALKVVHDIYKGWYPEPVTYTAWDGKEYTKNHIEIMQMYADCVFMKRSPNYKYDVKRVLKFAGVI